MGRLRTGRLRRVHQEILSELEDLSLLSRQPEICAQRNRKVSAWSVGQQLQHLAMSDRMILDGMDELLAGRLESAGGGPTAIGRLILLTGFIPRGKGRAPEGVVPEEEPPAKIEAGLDRVRSRFGDLQDQLETLSTSRATFRHPVMGGLSAARWLAFVHIHHRHHGKIIADIRRAADASAAD